MSNKFVPALLMLPAVLILGACDRTPAPLANASFKADVQPILAAHCAECHLNNGAGTQASGFVVESHATVMKGTKFGPVIVPGDPLSSSLYRLVAGKADPSIQMPHNKDALPAAEIAKIERWIELGAKND